MDVLVLRLDEQKRVSSRQKQCVLLSGHRLIIIYYIVNTWLNIAMVDNLHQKRSKLIMNTYMTSIRQIKRILCDIIHQCKHTSTQRSERKLLFNILLPLSNIIYERGPNLSYKRNIFHIAYLTEGYFKQNSSNVIKVYLKHFGHLRIINNGIIASYSIYAKIAFFAFQKDIGKKDINQYLWHINFKIDLTAVHCTKFFPLFFYQKNL